MAAAPPAQSDLMAFLWGVRDAARPHIIEFLVFDTYNATDCTDSGTNLMGGVVLDFGTPPQGHYRTTVDLQGRGLSIPTPTTGRIGINMRHFTDYDGGVYSDRGFYGLWITKNGFENEMGDSDDNGYEDFFFDNDGDLEDGECVRSEQICPTGEWLTGPAYLLLGATGGGNPCPSEACNGSEKLSVKASDRNGCRIKATIKHGTPGSEYGFTMTDGECLQATADSRGKASVKQNRAIDGEVEVPTCNLRKAVNCP